MITDTCYRALLQHLEPPYDLLTRLVREGGLTPRSALRLQRSAVIRGDGLNGAPPDLRESIETRARIFPTWVFPGRRYRGEEHALSPKAFQAALDRAVAASDDVSCHGWGRITLGDLRKRGTRAGSVCLRGKR